MPDQEQPEDSTHTDEEPQVRRVTQKDRKARLKSGPLFDNDDSPLPDDATIAAEAGSPFERPQAPPASPDLYPDTSAIDDNTLREKLGSPAERYPPLEFSADSGAIKPAAPAANAPKPASKRQRRTGDWRHNVVALLFLLGTVGAVMAFTWLWNNPYNPDNPFALATPFREVTTTPDPQAVFNAQATATAQAQPTPTPTQPPVSVSGLPFSISVDGVAYTANNNGSGCDWASIAGIVTGLEGEALNGYRVRITDATDASSLDVEAFTGAAAGLGDGGFEYVLGNAPRSGRYDVQLFSPAGAPVSDQYRIVTRATCAENVAIINFIQIEPF